MSDYLVPTRHPRFYFSDGGAIFKLNSADRSVAFFYNLHPGLLSERAGFFKSLFSLPRTPNCTSNLLTEGKSDENPIELSSCVMQTDFDNLLTYLYMGPSAHPKTTEFLISVMKLSVFFEIQDSVDHAKAEITRRGDCILPALRFELARCFGINEWIEPTFRRLMEMPLGDLSSSDVLQIGHFGYYWLTQTKVRITELRASISFNVPPVLNSMECPTPDYCARSWYREWVFNVRTLLHHPDQWTSCLSLLDQLRNVHIAGLCDACQDLTVTWIWGTQMLTREEDYIEEAIAALKDLQRNEPTRAVVSNSRILLSSDL
ncbi:hypothetical protein DFH08DRAFT_959689 [Mycena albidolilacea]|uniref:BTB domain-containing protein n=1 Tax=Mycena albidolilacea TaxID=1033008 RepID=A0AAD7A3I2_9AGAR|nr:hypothetical protein DFH08DRAFT_959689 [Mycena albidolilacea]